MAHSDPNSGCALSDVTHRSPRPHGGVAGSPSSPAPLTRPLPPPQEFLDHPKYGQDEGLPSQLETFKSKAGEGGAWGAGGRALGGQVGLWETGEGAGGGAWTVGGG